MILYCTTHPTLAHIVQYSTPTRCPTQYISQGHRTPSQNIPHRTRAPTGRRPGAHENRGQTGKHHEPFERALQRFWHRERFFCYY